MTHKVFDTNKLHYSIFLLILCWWMVRETNINQEFVLSNIHDMTYYHTENSACY